MKRLALTSGAPLAIDPKCIQRDADGFFLMLGPGTPDNERHGSVAVVHVRGALAQYKDDGGDSYEGLEERVRAALEEQPSAVVLRISSPGGVVAGLAQTTIKLRELCEGVPLIAYVSELAASAAYHLCCACDEILAPPSAVVGSVGVISTMVSLAKQDRMQGVEFRLITSGARKADGHLHAPISDAAEKAERDRNGQLASQFFDVVRKARRMSEEDIRGLEAGIYLAKNARAIGLIDDVSSFDEVLQGLEASVSRGPTPAPNNGNLTDRRARPLAPSGTTVSVSTVPAQNDTTSGDPMAVKLDALIAKVEAAIATEEDPKKRGKLAAQLAQYQATRVAMESDPETDPDGDDDEDGDEGKAAKANKMAEKKARMAEAAKHRAAAAKHKAKAAEYEEAAKKCEADDEEDDDAAALPEVDRGASAAAIADHADAAQEQRITKLERELADGRKATAIATALSNGEITPAQAKMLAGKRPKWVSEYLETTKGMRVVATEEGHLTVPRDGNRPAPKPDPEALAEIDRHIASLGLTDEAQIAKLRTNMIANRAAAMNGQAGRY